jgi:RNA polymerase sigma-70 factor (ECF subfamily)
MKLNALNYTGMRELPEETLLRLARAGEETAFAELMCRVSDRCLRLAVRILGNRDDARDEVQNALWKAYTHLSSFNEESRFSTWVARIVINNCHMRRRRNTVKLVPAERTNHDGELFVLHEGVERGTPEITLGANELSAVIRTELAMLPRLLRLPLQLHFIDELPVHDVARQLGLSPSATKSRIHRAQGFLRQRMIRHCGLRGAATLLRAA